MVIGWHMTDAILSNGMEMPKPGVWTDRTDPPAWRFEGTPSDAVCATLGFNARIMHKIKWEGPSLNFNGKTYAARICVLASHDIQDVLKDFLETYRWFYGLEHSLHMSHPLTKARSILDQRDDEDEVHHIFKNARPHFDAEIERIFNQAELAASWSRGF